jgi:hypothetical protein
VYYVKYVCVKCNREHKDTVDLPLNGEVTVRGFLCTKCNEAMRVKTLGQEPTHVEIRTKTD